MYTILNINIISYYYWTPVFVHIRIELRDRDVTLKEVQTDI